MDLILEYIFYSFIIIIMLFVIAFIDKYPNLSLLMLISLVCYRLFLPFSKNI